jgi:hypothetical protein
LTIKFARSMAASPQAFSYQLSALSLTTARLANPMAPLPAHRTHIALSYQFVSSQRFC